MNNNFSLKRMALYARKHYVENSKSYLYLIFGLIAADIFALSIRELDEVLLYPIMLFATVYGIQISCSSHYNRNSIEQSYTLPITTCEKYLFIWFNSIVIGTAVILGLTVFLSNVFSVALVQERGLAHLDRYFPAMWLFFFGAQAAALFSCCWVKNSPVKGYLLSLAIFIAFMFGYAMIWKQTTGAVTSTLFDSMHISLESDSGTRLSYSVFTTLQKNLSQIIFVLWMPALWLAGYFKFKERTLK